MGRFEEDRGGTGELGQGIRGREKLGIDRQREILKSSSGGFRECGEWNW